MSTNSMTTLAGWFKTVYGDKDVKLLPENLYYTKEVKATPADKQPGGTYSQVIPLTQEQGITLAGASAGAFAINSPIAMSNDFATINGCQFLLRSGIDYETIMRSASSKNAFISATKGVVKNALKSAYSYQEMQIMWGRRGLATVSSVSTNTITVTTAEWSSGLWLGSENRRLRIESSAGVLRGTCSVSSYDIANRTITVDSAPGGLTSTDIIFLEAGGATMANEMYGLYSILTPASASFWGINDSTYSLWAPSAAYNLSSTPLTFNKIMLAINDPVNKGLGDEEREIDVIVNPGAWAGLGNDLAALRSIDSSWKSEEATNGAEMITFWCQAGKVRIVPHRYMKEGYAFIHPKASKFFTRIGCQADPTFKLPALTADGNEYLLPMANNAGVEMRCYWNMAMFTERRSHGRVIYGIVNPTS